MSTKHTAGPWSVNADRAYAGTRIDGPNGRGVAHAIQRDPHPTLGLGISQEEAEANARLIATAPELLEALKAIANGVIVPPLMTEQARQMMLWQDAARAAIAKALGEQQ